MLRYACLFLEKEFQQLAIADTGRVEQDLDPLGMAAMVAIGGIGHVAAGVANARGRHPRQPADQILHAPEAAPRQYGTFGHHASST